MSETDHGYDPTGENTVFKDWHLSPFKDGYVNMVGPYYFKNDELGQPMSGFKAEARHLNGGGSVHGGCLLSLADTALFVISMSSLKGDGAVTMQLDAKFLSPGRVGDVIIATGKVTRAGASVIFAEGELKSGERILLTFTGILKRIKARITP